MSQAPVCKSFGGTAVVGSTVYVPCTDGVRAVRIDGAGSCTSLWHAAAGITGSPVVGGGRVWSLDPAAGVLHALDPRTGRNVAAVARRRDQPVRHAGDHRRATSSSRTLAGFTVVRTS